MKNFFMHLSVLAIILVSALSLNAQQMGPIPVDTNVVIGKLDNGLSYYIRHNEKPKGQADFYIAQKVGSMLEEDNQRGLAHFLEHMCFNGTENFPGKGIIEYLETIGVKFGENLNAYTSTDETVYRISNVPVSRTGVQDSCLLILHDWADGLLLLPEEIEAERGVIHEEWRRSNVGQMRVIEQLLPVVYPNSKYGHRLPIGTMEVVDNFAPQALRDYYETWYRPDQQGIVVVGDIDPAYIESKIKEYFGPITMPENAKQRVYLPVEDNQGTIFALGDDPEVAYGMVEIMFKTEAFPDEMKSDLMYLLYDYMTDMIGQMLANRLREIANKPGATIAHPSADLGNFFLAKTKSALSLEGLATGNDVTPAFETLYREALRAAKGGFTVGEYERAKAEYLSRLEKRYENRAATENQTYVNTYVRNFIDNEPMPSIDDLYEFYKMVVPMIPLDQINMVMNQIISPNNRVVLAMAPQKDGFVRPTEEAFKAAMDKVDAEDIEPYKDEMKSEPLIPSLPAPGKVVAEKHNDIWDATELTLSNGVNVIVKATSFKPNEILFTAIAQGGVSNVPEDKAASLILLPYIINQQSLGTYNPTDITKYLQGKQVGVSLGFDDYQRMLSGTTTVKDLPTMMELIYANFLQYDMTDDDFATATSKLSALIANQETTPQFVFQSDLMKVLYNSPSKELISSQHIAAANRQDFLNIVKAQLDNAADYTFVFVGDINIDTLKPLLEQYIATLPADASHKRAIEYNDKLELVKGNVSKSFTTPMQTPQTWCFIGIAANMPYNATNDVNIEAAAEVLSKLLLDKVREEMGATYSIGAVGALAELKKQNTMIQIPFPMKPEMKQEVLDAIDKILNDTRNDISEERVAAIKEAMVKEYKENLELNRPWLKAISNQALTGVDTLNTRLDAINALTADSLKAFYNALLDQGNKAVILLDAE